MILQIRPRAGCLNACLSILEDLTEKTSLLEPAITPSRIRSMIGHRKRRLTIPITPSPRTSRRLFGRAPPRLGVLYSLAGLVPSLMPSMGALNSSRASIIRRAMWTVNSPKMFKSKAVYIYIRFAAERVSSAIKLFFRVFGWASVAGNIGNDIYRLFFFAHAFVVDRGCDAEGD